MAYPEGGGTVTVGYARPQSATVGPDYSGAQAAASADLLGANTLITTEPNKRPVALNLGIGLDTNTPTDAADGLADFTYAMVDSPSEPLAPPLSTTPQNYTFTSGIGAGSVSTGSVRKSGVYEAIVPAGVSACYFWVKDVRDAQGNDFAIPSSSVFFVAGPMQTMLTRDADPAVTLSVTAGQQIDFQAWFSNLAWVMDCEIRWQV
jgi:hypothetical protein